MPIRIIAVKLRPSALELATDFFEDAGFAPEDAKRLVDSWIAFNELAAENGGYRVY